MQSSSDGNLPAGHVSSLAKATTRGAWPNFAEIWPTQDCCAQTTTGDSADQQCVSTHAEAPSQPELWPTPKPSEWANIALVAEKACLTLDWALSSKASREVVYQLLVQLCELLKCLVIGHLPDLGLDMYKLFRRGLQPVLAAQLVQCTGYRDLAVAMLSRLAVDCSLIPGGEASAGPQIISSFCEFLNLCKTCGCPLISS